MELGSLERVKGVHRWFARSRKERMKVSKGMTSKRENRIHSVEVRWRRGKEATSSGLNRHSKEGVTVCGRDELPEHIESLSLHHT